MSRQQTQDWPTLLQEYDKRIADDEKVTAIKADFIARLSTEEKKFSWGTFANKLTERRKAQPTTAAEDTTPKGKTARRKPSDTENPVYTAPRDPIQSIALEAIIADPEIQQRVQMTPSLIEEYLQLITDTEGSPPETEVLPPVVVFGPTDEGKYFLSEGFHRYEATKQAICLTITAEIRPGGYDEAIDYACVANTKHGLRPSERDRMKAVDTQLAKWPTRGDREISRKCGVSASTVGKNRAERINGTIIDNPLSTNEDVARQWGSSAKTVAAVRVSSVKAVLTNNPHITDEHLAQSRGVSLDVVSTMRAELYPPTTEEPSHETPVHLDTPHDSQGPDASIAADSQFGVQTYSPHDSTPEVKAPLDPVSAPEPADPDLKLKVALQSAVPRVQDAFRFIPALAQAETILGLAEHIRAYAERFDAGMDEVVCACTDAIDLLTEAIVGNAEVDTSETTTPTTSEATLPAMDEPKAADEGQGTDELGTCYECGHGLTVEEAVLCEHCGEMFHGPCRQSHMDQEHDAPDHEAE